MPESPRDSDGSGGLGSWLRGIDRDVLVDRDTAMKPGAALTAGSGSYVSMVHGSMLPGFVRDAVPYGVTGEVEADAAGLDYDALREYLPFDLAALKEETVHHLNKEVTDWDQFEGVGPVDGYHDLLDQVPNMVANAPEIIGTSFDEAAHLGISATVSTVLAGTADRLTGDYDPRAVAVGGMATVPLYFTFKEGWYEGGPGIDFDLDSLDVRGDLVMDIIGSVYGTYSYHRNQVASGEETGTGAFGSAARKAGRAYGRLEHLVEEYTVDDEPVLDEFEEPEVSFQEPEPLDVEYPGEIQQEVKAATDVDEMLEPSGNAATAV